MVRIIDPSPVGGLAGSVHALHPVQADFHQALGRAGHHGPVRADQVGAAGGVAAGVLGRLQLGFAASLPADHAGGGAVAVRQALAPLGALRALLAVPTARNRKHESEGDDNQSSRERHAASSVSTPGYKLHRGLEEARGVKLLYLKI